MKQKRARRTITGFVLLLVLVGCGKAQPITNPPSVETSLAGTARALAKQTETANPVTATATPIPTITLTPTPKISLNGTSLIVQEGGSALFVDHKAGVQLTIPAGWMALRVNEQEYYSAFTADVVLTNPAINEHLTQIQDADLNKFRLDAIDIREGHIPNGIISYMNVIFEPGDTRTLEQWAKAEGNQRKPFKNYKVVSLGYPKTEDGTKVLVMEETWSRDASNLIFYRGVFFSLPSGTLVLDFYTNKSFKDAVLPDFEQVVNSVKPIQP